MDAVVGWQPSTQAFARTFAAFAFVTVVIYTPTLTISPPVWGDEAHIVEYGRLFLEPHTSWSLFWQGDHGITPWYFIGTVAQEMAERATSPSCLGTRILGLGGGLLASAVLAAWLRRRGTHASAALLLGLLFLFEPAFAAAYRGGRLDGWAFSSVFCGCYGLSAWRTKGDDRLLWLAGGFVALGFFIWPSTAFLLPLVGMEFFPLPVSSSGRLLGVLTRFGTAAIVTALLLGLIAIVHVPNIPKDVIKQLFLAGMVPTNETSRFAGRFVEFFKLLFERSPWHLVLLVYGLRFARSYASLAWMLLPGTVVMCTLLYTNRILYLVPYIIVFYGEAFLSAERSADSKVGGFWILLGSVLCAGVVTLGLRSVNAWIQRDGRSESRLLVAAQTVPYAGETVCVEALEFYFAGRSLGWRMVGGEEDKLEYCQIAIVGAGGTGSPLLKALDSAGFRREATLLGSNAASKPVFGGHGFGPYDVYRRQALPDRVPR